VVPVVSPRLIAHTDPPYIGDLFPGSGAVRRAWTDYKQELELEGVA
jgi:hypothetical protein